MPEILSRMMDRSRKIDPEYRPIKTIASFIASPFQAVPVDERALNMDMDMDMAFSSTESLHYDH
jgi:hypothetical protein